MPEESEFIPRRLPHVQVHCEKTSTGDTYYVIYNPDNRSYIEIDPKNYFLWELMDGEHTLADLAITYYSKFGLLPFERLEMLIRQLETNGFLECPRTSAAPVKATGFISLLTHIADTTFQREFDWNQADEWFTRLYNGIGRFFFKKTVCFGLLLISIIGFICFIILEPTEQFQLLTFNESFGHGLIVLIVSGWIVLFFHETGHGLTCKFFGRRIHKAGIMFYYGMPAFFVDVSDMWMAGRTPRILVSLAGPIVNFIIGGVIAILVYVLPSSDLTEVLFQAAFVTYLIALLNMNPLLELDGYYCLMDWLEMPQLRKKSFDFLRTTLLSKIRSREGFDREEIIYSAYSILSIVITVLIVMFVLYIWENELSLMVHNIFTGQDILAVILIGGLTILAGTFLVIGFLAHFILFVYRVRDRIQNPEKRDDDKKMNIEND